MRRILMVVMLMAAMLMAFAMPAFAQSYDDLYWKGYFECIASDACLMQDAPPLRTGGNPAPTNLHTNPNCYADVIGEGNTC